MKPLCRRATALNALLPLIAIPPSTAALAIAAGIGNFLASGMAVAQSPGVHYGDSANCAFLSAELNVSRMQCKFMPISGSRNLHIEYVSGECVTTPSGSFAAKQFQIITMPNAQKQVSYQLPINKGSALGTGFVNGSYTFSATQTSIYANAGTPLYALVDLVFPLGGDSAANNISKCTVSLSGLLTVE